MTTAKKWSFYWVIAWKLLFSGGRVVYLWGNFASLGGMSIFLDDGGQTASIIPVGKTPRMCTLKVSAEFEAKQLLLSEGRTPLFLFFVYWNHKLKLLINFFFNFSNLFRIKEVGKTKNKNKKKTFLLFMYEYSLSKQCENNFTETKIFWLKAITLAKILLRQLQKNHIFPWQKPWQVPTVKVNLSGCRIYPKFLSQQYANKNSLAITVNQTLSWEAC